MPDVIPLKSKYSCWGCYRGFCKYSFAYTFSDLPNISPKIYIGIPIEIPSPDFFFQDSFRNTLGSRAELFSAIISWDFSSNCHWEFSKNSRKIPSRNCLSSEESQLFILSLLDKREKEKDGRRLLYKNPKTELEEGEIFVKIL